MKSRAVPANQLDDRQANRVGTFWRAGCEHAVRTFVARRCADQFESLGTIKYPEHEQVRKAFDVGETGLEFFIEFENSLGFVLRA